MKGQNFWILLLVSFQTAFVFCKNSSDEISSEKQNGTGIYEGDVQMSSRTFKTSHSENTPAILIITISSISVAIFLFLIGCICYRCILSCGKQTRYSGLILNSGRNQDASGVRIAQQVVVQQAPQPTKQNDQYIPQQNQPMIQPQYPPMQQFPPNYLPTQQFPPHNNPMQQFTPQNQPMQQFSPQQSPMKQFSPQHSPMQQFSPQNQPMQQFSQQHSPMQQFQGSATASQYQVSPESQALSNFPAAPPPYENDLPQKY